MKFKNYITAFFIIGILGTLSHFVYEWSGEVKLLGLIFPVNESVWEHLKLLFFPTLVYSFFEYRHLKEKPQNYLFSLAISVFSGMVSIVTLFYTISGVIGKRIDFINILIYFVGIIVMLINKNKILKSGNFSSNKAFWFALILLSLTAVLFVTFSFNPLKLGIFAPPEK